MKTLKALAFLLAALPIICTSALAQTNTTSGQNPIPPISDKQNPAVSVDIIQATNNADVIIVGSHPQEARLMSITGKVGGIIGYRIDATRFIKGVNTIRIPKDATIYPGVYISKDELHENGKEKLLLPAKTGVDDQFIYFLTERRASFNDFPAYKPISREAWFVPASSEAIKQIEAAIPQAQVWGRPSNGLTAGIRVPKGSYLPGEPVRIELHLKNISDHTILIPQQRLAANDYYPFLQFNGGTGIEVLSGGGASYGSSGNLYVFLEKPVGCGQKDVLPPIELLPGQVYVERIDLNSWQWTSSDGLQPFRPGANFKMHGWLTVKELDSEFRYSKEETSAMWKGELEFPWFDLNFLSNGTSSTGHTSLPK